MKAFGRSLPFVALLGPALLVLAALALYPVAQVLIDSFCRVDYAAGRRAFAGLANYRAVLVSRSADSRTKSMQLFEDGVG